LAGPQSSLEDHSKQQTSRLQTLYPMSPTLDQYMD
jgi:hypothetical protein